MTVVFLRAWVALPYSATFAAARFQGIGGTEQQLLAHAGLLRDKGHRVVVFGVSATDTFEGGVLFAATQGEAAVLRRLTEDFSDADVFMVNVSSGLDKLRGSFPNAIIVEVCQNGPHFANDKNIDVYALVGFGQTAYYSTKYPQYRAKFLNLPSVPPWRALYSNAPAEEHLSQVIWIGSVHKQGLRRWAKAMGLVMKRYPTLVWVLCAPSYDGANMGMPPAFAGIALPNERIRFANLPAPELAREVRRSSLMLASLGGEDGPVSYLDGHAAGIPVLCGDDIYGKYYTPEGTGLRCTTTAECIDSLEFLLARDDIRRRMGDAGRRWIELNLTEKHQEEAMERLIIHCQLLQSRSLPKKLTIQSDRKLSLVFRWERLEIRAAVWTVKRQPRRE